MSKLGSFSKSNISLSKEIAFCGDLPQPLMIGHFVTIIGTTLPYCSRYSIDFNCGKTDDPEKALHFNPRIEENYIVRNSYLHGKWGVEETTSCYKLNLVKRKTPFKISFFMSPKEFLVSLDDRHFCEYKHRVALCKITNVVIVGDVDIESVKTTEASEYPVDIYEVIPVLKFYKLMNKSPLPLPYIARLPVSLKECWQIEIEGKVKILPQNFYVNLQEGALIWPHPQIPLHLNPRFTRGSHSVIRNSWHHGLWGHEERVKCPFLPGYIFHLVIRIESDEFTVWINGKLTGSFKSKSRIDKIDTVSVQGDVIIYNVWINSQVQNMFLKWEDDLSQYESNKSYIDIM